MRKIVASMMAFVIFFSISTMCTTRAEENETEYWALVVCGGPPLDPAYPGSFLPNTAYMNHTLMEDYDFDADHVQYLYDRTNMRASHVRGAVRSYAKFNLTDENDIIFMYFSSHGNIRYDNQTKNEPGEYYDEGEEYRECTRHADLNGDGEWNTTDWVGEDESIGVGRVVGDPPEYEFDEYWDDELAEDLDYLKDNNAYGTLIVVRQGCRGGGLIDDISDSNRIIMTAASETGDSYPDQDGDGFSEWSEAFIDALHGHNTSYVDGQIVDVGSMIDADVNTDGHVSFLEAWEYAWNNDDARISGQEEPWLDDNGNGLPTHLNETDVEAPYDSFGDGSLAAMTWLPRKGHADLSVESRFVEGGETYYIDDVTFQVDNNPTVWKTPKTLTVSHGNHTVTIDDEFIRGDWRYTFYHWEDDSMDEEREMNLTSDTTITAYYYRSYLGGGCPFVYTWDGSRYLIDNNLLPASEINSEIDVEDYYVLQQALAPHNHRYNLMISEFEQEHSHFDTVDLLAVDHAPDTNIAITPTGGILTFKNPHAPVSVIDNHGTAVLDLLQEVDGNYYEGNARDYLLIDFKNLDVQQAAKLVLRADPPPGAGKWSIFVQVRNASMQWDTIAIVLPRVYWATEIIDLTNWLPDPNGGLEVRLFFTNTHRVDYVGLDTTPQEEYTLHQGILLGAIHSEYGFVGWKLRRDDQIYAELLPGQNIRLTFFVQPHRRSETERTFILYSEGHYHTIP